MRSYRKSMYRYNNKDNDLLQHKDYGPEPFVINLKSAALQNNYFRSTLWTGKNLQLTVMSLLPGEDVGLEAHKGVDQLLYVEQGVAEVRMGDRKDNLNFHRYVYENYAIIIPAGKWHNLTNIGKTRLKLFSIYAPPEHPHGTIHRTKADDVSVTIGKEQLDEPVIAPIGSDSE
ncbi:MAG TPA: cupin domain-containing protein [Clostridia bacterium]|nr:cupin domain-containing protein [Clostridia bacterium]